MKKIVCVILCVVMVCFVFAGCGILLRYNAGQMQGPAPESAAPNIPGAASSGRTPANAVMQSAQLFAEEFAANLKKLGTKEVSKEDIRLAQDEDSPRRVSMEFDNGIMILLADKNNEIMAGSMMLSGDQAFSAQYISAAFSIFSRLVPDQTYELIRDDIVNSEDASLMEVELDGMVQGAVLEDYSIAIMGNAETISKGGGDYIRGESGAGTPPEVDVFAAAHGIS